jgi:glutathione synthase/RimK-type ligase-like ATP-grasp enzyme
MSEYVTGHRALVEGIRCGAHTYGVGCRAYADDWLLRLSHSGRTISIWAYSFDCNAHAAGVIAKDKVLTYQLLTEKDIPAVPHYLLNSLASPEVDRLQVRSLLAEHGDIVVKPLQGMRGESVARFSDAARAVAFMEREEPPLWAASPYLEIDHELRLVVFDGAIHLAYKKIHPVVVNGLKMFNLEHGADAEPLNAATIDPAVIKHATDAMDALGLHLAAVDIVVTPDGRHGVLEINSGFSLERYARLRPANRAQVVAFYERLVGAMFGLTV